MPDRNNKFVYVLLFKYEVWKWMQSKHYPFFVVLIGVMFQGSLAAAPVDIIYLNILWLDIFTILYRFLFNASWAPWPKK